jgi:curved DNA-binding protein CbpA
MPARSSDPYGKLGVTPSATDAELRAAYRRLVQLHHPDHNGGSAESARRFEEIQAAYARIRQLRDGPARADQASGAPKRAPVDPDLESRLADMERGLRDARAAREAAERAKQAAREAAARVRQAAREASAPEGAGRPSDEELGYVTTDDSFSKIVSDARSALTERFSEAREHPAAKRVSDLIDELDQLVSRAVRNPKR